MRRSGTSKRWAAARRDAVRLEDERRELELLKEFSRCESVASLAGAIATRLGCDARSLDLIQRAGLAADRHER